MHARWIDLQVSASGASGGTFDVGPYEHETIALIEVDTQGRRRRFEEFADNRLGAAVARLYERYAELLPAGQERSRAAATARSVAAMVAPPDLDRYASALAPDVVFVDHRTVGFASGRGANTLLRGFRSLFDLADDLTTRVDDVLGLEPGVLLLRWTIAGTDRTSGGAFESEFLLLWLFGPDGLVVHDETFDADREAEAITRFDALVGSTAAEAPAEPRATRFANAATRAWDRMLAFYLARDWQRYAQLHPAGFRYSDRRRMAQLELDRDQYLEFVRQLGDMSSTRVEPEVLATRGERLALARGLLEVADAAIGPSEIESLNLIETDDHGVPVAFVRFDPEDLDAAYAELDARYDAGEAAAHDRMLAWQRALLRIFADRDWDALTAQCAPTLVAHDHRLVGWGTLRGPAAWVQTLRSLVDLAPDARPHLHHVRLSDRGWLAEGAMLGTRDGGMFEIPSIAVGELDELGKQHRLDLYELDALDAALARFAELSSEERR